MASPLDRLGADLTALEAEVDRRLGAVAAAVPSAAAFARSVERDRAHHRRERAALGLAGGAVAGSPPDASLAGLRRAQQDLVQACLGGLPTARAAGAAGLFARQLCDLARHLAVIDLWAEDEEARG